MADPLSIASGVAGLVSLGITLCNGLHTFLSAVRDRDKDLEDAIKENSLLRFHLMIIKANQSRVPSHHAQATQGINLGLKECESQLKSLETFIEELTSSYGLSSIDQLWRKQKAITRYPFDKKRLIQLQSQLSKANSTLGSFVQALNL
jgi:hypothetical protein